VQNFDQPEFLEFACNAGNAGNAGIMRRLSRGPVPFSEVIEQVVTRYNGERPQSVRLLVARLRGERIDAWAQSTPLAMKPGQTVLSTRFGPPRARGLYPRASVRVSQGQFYFVKNHIQARRFVDAVKAGDGRAVSRMLGMRDAGDAVVIATLPVKTDLAAWTMHPAIIEIDGGKN